MVKERTVPTGEMDDYGEILETEEENQERKKTTLKNVPGKQKEKEPYFLGNGHNV